MPSPSKIIVEACVGSLKDALHAAWAGSDRIEFCRSLEVGGLTPKLNEILELKDRLPVPMAVMIRPREGNFLYSAAEWSAMLKTAAQAIDAGANAIVFGALTVDGFVDEPKIAEMIAVVKSRPDRQLVFHRAIDESIDPWKSWLSLKALGINRVLTSGGASTAFAGLEAISKMEADSQQNGGLPTVLAAGGIRSSNVIELLRRTGVRQVHSACSRKRSHSLRARRYSPIELDEREFSALVRAVREFESHQIAGGEGQKTSDLS